jgi:hypothetical protein
VAEVIVAQVNDTCYLSISYTLAAGAAELVAGGRIGKPFAPDSWSGQGGGLLLRDLGGIFVASFSKSASIAVTVWGRCGFVPEFGSRIRPNQNLRRHL